MEQPVQTRRSDTTFGQAVALSAFCSFLVIDWLWDSGTFDPGGVQEYRKDEVGDFVLAVCLPLTVLSAYAYRPLRRLLKARHCRIRCPHPASLPLRIGLGVVLLLCLLGLVICGGFLNRIRGGWRPHWLPTFSKEFDSRQLFAGVTGALLGLARGNMPLGALCGVMYYLGSTMGWGCYFGMARGARVPGSHMDCANEHDRWGMFDWLVGKPLINEDHMWPLWRMWARDWTGMFLRGLAWLFPVGLALFLFDNERKHQPGPDMAFVEFPSSSAAPSRRGSGFDSSRRSSTASSAAWLLDEDDLTDEERGRFSRGSEDEDEAEVRQLCCRRSRLGERSVCWEGVRWMLESAPPHVQIPMLLGGLMPLLYEVSFDMALFPATGPFARGTPQAELLWGVVIYLFFAIALAPPLLLHHHTHVPARHNINEDGHKHELTSPTVEQGHQHPNGPSCILRLWVRLATMAWLLLLLNLAWSCLVLVVVVVIRIAD